MKLKDKITRALSGAFMLAAASGGAASAQDLVTGHITGDGD